MKACAFTGHRDIPAADLDKVTAWLRATVHTLVEEGVTHFISGGARGFDLLAAEAVSLERQTSPLITLEIAVPCPNQTRGWSPEDVYRYERMLLLADEKTVLSDHYFRGCMQARNRYMIDHADICVAYITKETGGTAYTVNYAEKKGKQIIRFE